MPSFQWNIRVSFPPEQLTLLAINNTSSVSWLKIYRGQYGISYPFVYDQKSELFKLYQVGGSFGNNPPTYVIIDKAGVTRYRLDKEYNRFEEMKAVIDTLLTK